MFWCPVLRQPSHVLLSSPTVHQHLDARTEDSPRGPDGEESASDFCRSWLASVLARRRIGGKCFIYLLVAYSKILRAHKFLHGHQCALVSELNSVHARTHIPTETERDVGWYTINKERKHNLKLRGWKGVVSNVDRFFHSFIYFWNTTLTSVRSSSICKSFQVVFTVVTAAGGGDKRRQGRVLEEVAEPFGSTRWR